MERLIFCVYLLCNACILQLPATAQTYYQLTDTIGSQKVGGINVDVSRININANITYCSYGPYLTAALNNPFYPKSYKYTFSAPVYAVRSHLIEVDDDDTLLIKINDVKYNVTKENLSEFSFACGGESNTIIAYNGMISGTSHTAISKIVMLDIHPGYPIYTLEFIENRPATGILWDFYFSPYVGSLPPISEHVRQ